MERAEKDSLPDVVGEEIDVGAPNPEECLRESMDLATRRGLAFRSFQGDGFRLEFEPRSKGLEVEFFLGQIRVFFAGTHSLNLFYQDELDAPEVLSDVIEIVSKLSGGDYKVSQRRRGVLRRRTVSTVIVRVEASDESAFVLEEI